MLHAEVGDRSTGVNMHACVAVPIHYCNFFHFSRLDGNGRAPITMRNDAYHVVALRAGSENFSPVLVSW